jgi:hypothetical protein
VLCGSIGGWEATEPAEEKVEDELREPELDVGKVKLPEADVGVVNEVMSDVGVSLENGREEYGSSDVHGASVELGGGHQIVVEGGGVAVGGIERIVEPSVGTYVWPALVRNDVSPEVVHQKLFISAMWDVCVCVFSSY